MAELCNNAKIIRQNGWKQGSFIKLEDPVEISESRGIVPLGLYIVISQICDIQTPTLETEPYVEIILCETISKIDGNLVKGKNIRKIQFTTNEKKYNFQCQAKNKFFLPREILMRIKPCENYMFTQELLDDFNRWLTKRYMRAAFPDEFNNRKDQRALREILKKEAHDQVDRICIKLHSEAELSAKDKYKLDLIIYINDATTDVERKKIEEKILNKMIISLQNNSGISVENGEVKTYHEGSAAELLTLKDFDFDDFSFSE